MRENINPLIKSCSTRTDPAAETESIGQPADAQLSWFLQSHLDSFTVTRDSQPSTGIRPSTRILPSGQFCLDQKAFVRQPGLAHLVSFAWTTKLSAIYRDFIWTKKIVSIYRDCAKTHASACRCRQLIKPPGRYVA
jgi:hypothetical protein